MNKILLSILLILSSTFGFCQTELTETQLEKLKFEIEKEADILRQKLEKEDYELSDEGKVFAIDFQIDTFKIESLFNKRMDTDYSTVGMVSAAMELEKDYDALLNKYYKILLGKLNTTDKEILKKSQRNWIAFRDSERQLNAEISKDEYSGGGTIQQLIVSSNYLDITKKRVLELYDYLERIN